MHQPIRAHVNSSQNKIVMIIAVVHIMTISCIATINRSILLYQLKSMSQGICSYYADVFIDSFGDIEWNVC